MKLRIAPSLVALVALVAALAPASRATPLQEGAPPPGRAQEAEAQASDEAAQAEADALDGLREELRAAEGRLREAIAEVERARIDLEEAGEGEADAAQEVLSAAKVEAKASAEELLVLVDALEERGESLEDLRELAATQLGAAAERKEVEETVDEQRAAAKERTIEELRRELGPLEAKYRAAIQQVEDARDALAITADDQKAQAEETLKQKRAARTALGDRLQVVLTELRSRGETGPKITELEQLLTVQEGLKLERMSADVAIGLFAQWTDQTRTWLVENGPELIFQAVLFVLIVLGFRILGGILAGIVRRALSSSRLRLSNLLRDFAVGLTRKATVLAGLLIALATVGVPIGPVLAGLGIIGFILGFALQDVLSNFASGMMLLVYRPFDVGDAVQAGGISGKVEAMTLVSTTILTFDNQLQVVPNNRIWGDVITNITARPTRRVDLVFGIGYSDDVRRAEEVLREVVQAHPKVLDDPPLNIRVNALGESSVDFIVRPWCRTADYWDIYWDLTRDVKLRFDAEGITIPFPQRDVHVHATSANGLELVPRERGEDDASGESVSSQRGSAKSDSSRR